MNNVSISSFVNMVRNGQSFGVRELISASARPQSFGFNVRIYMARASAFANELTMADYM